MIHKMYRIWNKYASRSTTMRCKVFQFGSNDAMYLWCKIALLLKLLQYFLTKKLLTFLTVLSFLTVIFYVLYGYKTNIKIHLFSWYNGARVRADQCSTSNTTRPDICDHCFQHNYEYLIKNDHICKLVSLEKPVVVVVLITTKPSEKNERNVIRQTWLNWTVNNTGDVRYVFILGKAENGILSNDVIRENAMYHDIIQTNFIDSYRNLTVKTIMGLKWTATKCGHAQFVFKVDSDMWLNIPSLLNFIKKHGLSLKDKVGGLCYSGEYPCRESNEKWFVSCEEYPYSTYPCFCSGTGYVTSMGVVKKLYGVFSSIPFLAMEDVYIGLCLEQLKLGTKTFNGFYSHGAKLPLCEFKKDTVITVHKIYPEKLDEIWTSRCP